MWQGLRKDACREVRKQPHPHTAQSFASLSKSFLVAYWNLQKENSKLYVVRIITAGQSFILVHELKKGQNIRFSFSNVKIFHFSQFYIKY